MRKRTVRLVFKWSFAIDLVLFAAVVLDVAYGGSRFMVPLIGVYVVFTLLLGCLLFVRDPTDAFLTMRSPTEPAGNGKKTVVYWPSGQP